LQEVFPFASVILKHSLSVVNFENSASLEGEFNACLLEEERELVAAVEGNDVAVGLGANLFKKILELLFATSFFGLAPQRK